MSKYVAGAIIIILISLVAPVMGQDKVFKPKRDVTIKMKSGESKSGKFILAASDKLELEILDKGRTVLSIDDIESIVFVRNSKPNPAYSAESLRDAQKAIKALYTLMTAVQVGVNRRDYGTRLIDVKIAVEESLVGLPDEELKKKLNLTLYCYELAAQVWDFYITDNSPTMRKLMYEHWDSAKKALTRAAELFNQIVEASK